MDRCEVCLTIYSRQAGPCPPREACARAHHWCREIRKLGEDVRLKAPEHVKPFVKRQKNDAVDAEAIAKAASRPTMEVFTVPLHLPCG